MRKSRRFVSSGIIMLSWLAPLSSPPGLASGLLFLFQGRLAARRGVRTRRRGSRRRASGDEIGTVLFLPTTPFRVKQPGPPAVGPPVRRGETGREHPTLYQLAFLILAWCVPPIPAATLAAAPSRGRIRKSLAIADAQYCPSGNSQAAAKQQQRSQEGSLAERRSKRSRHAMMARFSYGGFRNMPCVRRRAAGSSRTAHRAKCPSWEGGAEQKV